MTDFRSTHITQWTPDQREEAEAILAGAGQLFVPPTKINRVDVMIECNEPDLHGHSPKAYSTTSRILSIVLQIDRKMLQTETNWDAFGKYPGGKVDPATPVAPTNVTPPEAPQYSGEGYHYGKYTLGDGWARTTPTISPKRATSLRIDAPDDIPPGYLVRLSGAHATADNQVKVFWISKAPGGPEKNATVWTHNGAINLVAGRDFEPGDTFYLNARSTQSKTFFYQHIYEGLPTS